MSAGNIGGIMPKRVMIIDDDHDMVESLTMILEGNGYEVCAAFQASDAVTRVHQEKPDLIILDVMFPENPSSGFELARALKNDSATSGIPIFIVSAVNARFNLGFSEKDRDASWLPVNHFIEKPIVPATLIKMVKEAIGQ